MTPTREVQADGWRVRLDLARQVLRLEVPEDHIDWHQGRRKAAGPPLSPILPLPEDGPVSAATLLLKAKQLDDGLYAAVELAAQQGLGGFPGKASLLRSLAATLAGEVAEPGKAAATIIHAACRLGGLTIPTPDSFRAEVANLTADFLRDELASKPLGFYTWTPELSAIFRQDRLLQQPLDPGHANALARALERTPGARDAHEACLRLHACLTNPAKPPCASGMLGNTRPSCRPPALTRSPSSSVSTRTCRCPMGST